MNKTQDIRNRARLSVRFYDKDDVSPEKTTAASSSASPATRTPSILSKTQRISPAPGITRNGYGSEKSVAFDFRRDTNAVVAYKALSEANKKTAASTTNGLGLPPKTTAKSAQEEKSGISKLDHYIDEYDVKCIEVQSPKYVLNTLPFTAAGSSRDSNRSSAESSTGSDLIARIEARYASRLKALHKEPSLPKMESHQARLENLAKDLEAIMASEPAVKKDTVTTNGQQKRSASPIASPTAATTKAEGSTKALDLEDTKVVSDSSKYDDSNSKGRYVNWAPQHSALTTMPWCCIGDLMNFCDRYEYKTLNRTDVYTHNRIVVEVKALLNSHAPFDMRKRFPDDVHSPENLWVCIGRCAGVEYHLNRILNLFRRPLDKLSADKQRMVRHDFHLSLNELRLDISARITEVRLYDRNVFEKEFHLEWLDGE